MFSLSIQLRQALGKLTLPLLLGLAVLVMLVGQADRKLAESARTGVADLLAPLYALLSEPIDRVRAIGREARSLVGVADENERLRAENMRLRRWYDVAMALAAENATLKGNLNWMPEPTPSFVTARAVADASGVYARSVLLSVPLGQTLSKGMVAIDAAGLVGRVTEVGRRSARVMLLSDMTSRVPVTLEASHAAAIVAGNNSAAPRLMDYPEDVRPVEGERVVTSGIANAFPAGLPVGTVHFVSPGNAVLEPYARLDHVTVLRLFDYGLSSIDAPDAPGRVPPRAHAGGLDRPVPGTGRGIERGTERGTGPGAPVQIGRG